MPYMTLALAAMAVVIALTDMAPLLELHRTAVGEGQVWRMLTGHFAHFGWNHLAWDAAVFVVLGAWLEMRSRVRFVTCLFMSSLLVGLTFWLGRPDLTTYRGLSGIDSALFGAVLVSVAVDAWRRRQHFRGMGVVLMASTFFGKTLFEIHTGATLFTDHTAGGFVPVPMAHLVGFLSGVAACVPVGSVLDMAHWNRGIARDGAENQHDDTQRDLARLTFQAPSPRRDVGLAWRSYVSE